MFIVVSVASEVDMHVQHTNEIAIANEIQTSKKPKSALALTTKFRITAPAIDIQIPT